MYPELKRNMPGNPQWEASFFERLTEFGEWNAESFWILHLELLSIAKAADTKAPVNRDLVYMLLYLQQRVLSLISAHFNENDIFEIANIEPDLLFQFEERFEIAVLSAISGKWLPESSFDLINPLVKNA
jgi:hypothetical protein